MIESRLCSSIRRPRHRAAQMPEPYLRALPPNDPYLTVEGAFPAEGVRRLRDGRRGGRWSAPPRVP